MKAASSLSMHLYLYTLRSQKLHAWGKAGGYSADLVISPHKWHSCHADSLWQQREYRTQIVTQAERFGTSLWIPTGAALACGERR